MSKKRIATIYDYARMCKRMRCEECPLSDCNNGHDCGCGAYMQSHIDEANEIILKWCDEHPVKTYKQDFLEKFPKVRLGADGVPKGGCVDYIYNTTTECDNDCSACWNRPMEGSDE